MFERISCEIRAEESGRIEDKGERLSFLHWLNSGAINEITLIVSENRIRGNGRVNVHY